MYLLKCLLYALALVSAASISSCAPISPASSRKAELASPELIPRTSTTYTDAQYTALKTSYAFNNFISGQKNKDRLDALAEETKLSRQQVLKWFGNRRILDNLKQPGKKPKPADTPTVPPPPLPPSQPAVGPSSQPLVSPEASPQPLLSTDLTLAPLPDGPPLPVTEILPLSESGKAQNLAKGGAGASAGMRNLKLMNRSPKPRSGSPMNRNRKATSRTPKSTGKNLKSSSISPKSNGSTRRSKAQQNLPKQNFPTPSSKSKPKRGAMATLRPKSKPKARRRV